VLGHFLQFLIVVAGDVLHRDLADSPRVASVERAVERRVLIEPRRVGHHHHVNDAPSAAAIRYSALSASWQENPTNRAWPDFLIVSIVSFSSLLLGQLSLLGPPMP
jgi:hypothetical protein